MTLKVTLFLQLCKSLLCATADGHHVKCFLEVMQDGMDHIEQYV